MADGKAGVQMLDRFTRAGTVFTATALVVALLVGTPITSRDNASSFTVPSPNPITGTMRDGTSAYSIPATIHSGYFTENLGQMESEDVLFYGTANDVQVGFSESAVLLKIVERSSRALSMSLYSDDPWRDFSYKEAAESVRGALVLVTFEGSNPVMPEGRGQMAQRNNYFLGSDPADWRTGVRNYREIVYRNLYDGVDLIYRIDGGLKYDLVIGPGGDLGGVSLSYEGVERLDVENGNLLMQTAAGPIRDAQPVSYQGTASVSCGYSLLGRLSHGFTCSGYDPSSPLVIDPLIYSTFIGGSDLIGGSGSDHGHSIATGSSGEAYILGDTGSFNFPVTPGAFDTAIPFGGDCFVAKLTPTGDGLVYATFLGGNDTDICYSLTIDSLGNAYVTGATVSVDFPTTPGALDVSLNGAHDCYLSVVNATGSGLLYSTYIGGLNYDASADVALDQMGNIYLVGVTASSNFPVTPGAFDATKNGQDDAFALKLNLTSGSLVYSTFIGGSDDDAPGSLALDPLGNVYLAGATASSDFPTTPGAFDRTINNPPGTQDAFVIKLNSTGSVLDYSTLVGGANVDYGYSIAVDSSGFAHVVGSTESFDFPSTPGAYNTTKNSGSDIFALKLNSTGGGLVYSTFIGGSSREYGGSATLDASGNLFFGGDTSSHNFPITPNAFDATHIGLSEEGFIAVLDANGANLVYSTFVGGDASLGTDHVYSIALSEFGVIFVAGSTSSDDFPTTPGAFDTTFDGPSDAFVLAMNITADEMFTITVTANEPGLDIEVDGVAWTIPHSFPCPQNASHIIDAPTPQIFGDVRYDFSLWSDGPVLPLRTIVCNSSAVYMAMFETRYKVTLLTSPPGLDTGFGIEPVELWFLKGDIVMIGSPPSPQFAGNTRYMFVQWMPDPSGPITMPIVFTAIFSTEYRLTLTTVPTGRQILLDGGTITAPFNYWCLSGTIHHLDVPSPQIEGPWDYSFDAWSDGMGKAHDVTCNASMTLTASFTSASLGDFSLQVNPTSVTIRQTERGSATVSVIALEGFSGQVYLSVDNVPVDVNCWMSPGMVDAPNTSRLMIDVSPYAIPGIYQLAVTGRNGSLIHTATLQLIIEATNAETEVWVIILPVVLILVAVNVVVLLLIFRKKRRGEEPPKSSTPP